MAIKTQINSVRTVVTMDGVEKFRLSVYCTEKGDLDDKNIFLLEIFDDNDPQEDIFERVVSIADFETFKTNRDQAVAAGDGYWRSSTFTKYYTDLEVAVAAVELLNDLINKLVSAVDLYNEDFVTGGEVKSFPSVDPGVVDILKTTYDTAYTAYQAALTAETTAEAERDLAEAILLAAETPVTEWENFEEGIGRLYDEMLQTRTDFNSFVNSDPSKNATWFRDRVNEFLDAFDNYFPILQRVTALLAGYVPAVPADIGKMVTGAPSGASGIMFAYDNTYRYWWIDLHPGSVDFATGDNLDIVGGAGDGTVDVVWDDADIPLYTERALLEGYRATFANRIISAQEEISAADAGVTDHATIKAEVEAIVPTKEIAITIGRTTLATAEAALIEAKASTSAAYTNLETAYSAVKDACPSWVPTDSFPPIPA